MWALEYSNKMHGQILCIPYDTEEKAMEGYRKIKEKVGINPYSNKKLELDDLCIELKTQQGITTIDCSVIAAVWVLNTEDPIVMEFEDHVSKRNKRRRDLSGENNAPVAK